MATTFIRVPQTGGAPEDYLVSGAADIDLLSASAHFDGSGAGVDFFPAIQVLDEAGQVSATVVGPKVTAGGSADVTFAPFLESADAGGGGGGGIIDLVSTDAAIAVAAPTGPTTYLTAFKPRFEWAHGTFTVTGPGSIGGAVTWAHSHYSSLLDFTTPTAPVPYEDGWYQATMAVRVDGLNDGDQTSAVFTNAYGSGVFGLPAAVATASPGLGSGAPPLVTRLDVGLPTIPYLTTDAFSGIVGIDTTAGTPIDVTADLLVSFLRPGVP